MNRSEKPEVILDDNAAADDVAKDDGYGLVKSRFDELSIPRTLWVFRRVVLVSLAVYTGYVCEGFEVSKRCLDSCGTCLMRLQYSSALEAVSLPTLASSSSLVRTRAKME